jgi:chloramphenicol 3-O phosphotransferase
MKPANIIILNGTSSSGKTSIAKALQDKLPVPYMHVSGLGFLTLYNDRIWEEDQAYYRIRACTMSGMHASVAVLARAGNPVILDHILHIDGWLQELVELLDGLNVYFVGVMCPLEVAENRENQRSDRQSGTAREQLEPTHAHGLYDLEVDTSVLNVDECADKIVEGLQEKPEQSAFEKLAVRFSG